MIYFTSDAMFGGFGISDKSETSDRAQPSLYKVCNYEGPTGPMY